MARVTVRVNVRDLTAGDMNRLNQRFNRLGDSLNRFAGNQNQDNLNRLRGSIQGMGEDLNGLRGRIPEDEFNRLNTQLTRLRQNSSNAIGGTLSPARLGELRGGLRDLDGELRRLGGSAGNGIRVRVHPPSQGDQNRVRRVIRNMLTSPWRTFGGLVGGTLSDGVGQGLAGGFRNAASNPIVLAGLTALVAAVVSMLGAAVAAALVLAIGGAFVAAGVIAAFQSDKVRKKWTDTLKDLKPLFQDAASGLLPVIEHARQEMVRIATAFAPHFKDALTAAGPHIQTFMDRIINGFTMLGKKAAAPLEEAFNVLLDALGPDLEGTLSGMGDALAALANTVTNHSTEIAEAFNMIIGLITTAIDIINFLANAWVTMSHLTNAAIGRVILGMATLVEMSLNAVGKILGAFAHIPFIGEQFKKAQTAFNAFKDDMVGGMRRSGQALIDYGHRLDILNKERKLRVDTASWQAKLIAAKAQLKSVPPEKKSALKALIADLEKKVRQAKASLASLHDRNVNIFVNTVYSDMNKTTFNKKTGRYQRASGGNVGIGAAATGGARSNLTMVGEQGPELVDFSAGRVRSNSDSRRIMSQGSGGMEPFYIMLDVGGERLAEVLVDPFRKAVSRRGGVQATFGKL